MNIDYIVMGHESRYEYIKDIIARLLDYQPGTIKVAIDNDERKLGAWGCAREAWGRVDPKSDYGVVIQDDAILCEDFKNKVDKFLTRHKGHVVSFYYGDDPKHNKWVQPDHFDAPLYHAVCLAIPTKQIPDMIAYCDKKPEAIGDDMKIKRWLISQNRTCRYSNPSLVQHRDIPSIVDPTKPTRQSAIYKQ